VKNVTVAKFKKGKIGCNLAESSKESYGSKRVVLPLMMMMMHVMIWKQKADKREKGVCHR
jgi:hypothetical protein